LRLEAVENRLALGGSAAHLAKDYGIDRHRIFAALAAPLRPLVWAATELLVTAEPYAGLMQYYESQRAAMSASCDRSSINCLKTRITVVFGARVEHS
jgi:hypothetical protein